MSSRRKVKQHQSLLTVIAILALAVWGVYAVLWTFPNDEGSIINAVLDGEYQTGALLGPNGNGSIVRPGVEAQFVLSINTGSTAQNACGACSLPNGGSEVGVFGWTPPSSTLFSFEKRYAVFSYSFRPISLAGSYVFPLPRFTGPQGNMSQSFHTAKYAGSEVFSQIQDTAILEVPLSGNYTLHYVNLYTVNASARVIMGPSSVVYSRPYLYAAIPTLAIAGGLAIATVTRSDALPRRE